MLGINVQNIIFDQVLYILENIFLANLNILQVLVAPDEAFVLIVLQEAEVEES